MAASDEIVGLERRFWQSMVEKDVDTATAMIADECLVTGPHGAMKIDPDKYAEMTRDGKWTLDSFEFSDVNVVFPADDVAVMATRCIRRVRWVTRTWICTAQMPAPGCGAMAGGNARSTPRRSSTSPRAANRCASAHRPPCPDRLGERSLVEIVEFAADRQPVGELGDAQREGF